MTRRIVVINIIVVLLFGIASNIASSTFPEAWIPYRWFAWPVLIILGGISIAIELWLQRTKQRELHTADSPSASVPTSETVQNLIQTLLHPSLPAQSQALQPEIAFSHSIPKSPQPYIAHTYTLLQTEKVIGRQKELTRLTNWINASPQHDRIQDMFIIVAMGGMGKSALIWQWFNQIALKGMPQFSGYLWWNFYRDANFEHFVRHALSYVSNLQQEQVNLLLRPECEEQLLNVLRKENYLLVLDGFERILNAYPNISLEASFLQTVEASQHYGEHTINALQSPLRQTTDPRIGIFLQELAQVSTSRILIATRLYPSALETTTGETLPQCIMLTLEGLSDEDALELWKMLGLRGSPILLGETFKSFKNYPLLIKVLAGLVARDRIAPGDFDAWHKNNPHLNFAGMPFTTIRQHVLAVAIGALDSIAQRILYTIAAVYTPISYDALRVLLVGNEKLCARRNELDSKLEELEDRGLLGWDKKYNRYDVHPVIQNMLMAQLDEQEKKTVYTRLLAYFKTLPKVELATVQNWYDLIPDIEIYNALIGLGEYSQALAIFRKRMEVVLLDQLSDTSRAIDLLKMLFIDADEIQPPRLANRADQGYVLHTLARAYQFSEQPGRSVPLHRQALQIFEKLGILDMLEITRVLLGDALHASGQLYEAEVITRSMAANPLKDYSRAWIWMQFLMMTRGEKKNIQMPFLRQLAATPWKKSQPSANNLALGMFRLKEYALASELTTRAEEQVQATHSLRDKIRAMRMKGALALQKGHLEIADKELSQALLLAHDANYAEGVLPALIGLAEIARRRHNFVLARAYLARVWQPAASGPYPLIHADACNILAQIERDQNKPAAAIKAALEAYRLSWCDGPPFVYQRGQEEARTHLHALRADNQLPSLPKLQPRLWLNQPFPLPDDLI